MSKCKMCGKRIDYPYLYCSGNCCDKDVYKCTGCKQEVKVNNKADHDSFRCGARVKYDWSIFPNLAGGK